MAFDWPLYPFDPEDNTYAFYFDVPTGRIKETASGLVYPFTWVLTQDATGYKNPKQFATAETADKILTWAEKHFSSPNFKTKQLASMSPFSTAPYFGEFQIEAEANEIMESFNVGLLAFTLAKFGDAYAKEFFASQLKIAGLAVVDNAVVIAVAPNKPANPKPVVAAKPLTEKEKAPVEGI